MTMIDCREAVSRMWDYLSRDLDAVEEHEVEAHLGVCRRCCGELEFSRALRAMAAASGAERLPPAARDRINELIDEPKPSPETL